MDLSPAVFGGSHVREVSASKTAAINRLKLFKTCIEFFLIAVNKYANLGEIALQICNAALLVKT